MPFPCFGRVRGGEWRAAFVVDELVSQDDLALLRGEPRGENDHDAFVVAGVDAAASELGDVVERQLDPLSAPQVTPRVPPPSAHRPDRPGGV